jgi:hypothetical protein
MVGLPSAFIRHGGATPLTKWDRYIHLELRFNQGINKFLFLSKPRADYYMIVERAFHTMSEKSSYYTLSRPPASYEVSEWTSGFQAAHSSGFSTKGARRCMRSSSLSSSPSHCCITPPTFLGGMITLLTTWTTPSLATPSAIATRLKPLILMVMNRPYRATSTLSERPSRRVGRSTWRCVSKNQSGSKRGIHGSTPWGNS